MIYLVLIDYGNAGGLAVHAAYRTKEAADAEADALLTFAASHASVSVMELPFSDPPEAP
jgi:hypothetical protein